MLLNLLLITFVCLPIAISSPGVCQTAIIFSPSPNGTIDDHRLLASIKASGLHSSRIIQLTDDTPAPAGHDTLLVFPASLSDEAASQFFYTDSPALVLNRGIWAQVGMTSKIGGYNAGVTNVMFINSSHPVAAGLVGSQPVFTQPETVYHVDGKFPLSSTNVVIAKDHSDNPSIFAVEVSPGRGRRVGLGIYQYAFITKQLDTVTQAAVQWICSQGIVPPPPSPPPPSRPEQMHIAFGENSNSMVIAWASKVTGGKNKAQAVIHWAEQGMQLTNTMNATSHVLGSYIKHHATIKKLIPGSIYSYQVSWAAPWDKNVSLSSDIYNFTAKRDDVDWSPRIVLFGDLGWTDDQLLPYLGKESAIGTVDAIVLYGDMIYWPNGESENSFMRDISNLSAASIPFHVTPGNGDSEGNFSIYRNNFFMPGWETSDSLWHSFDIGRAHIIGVSCEAFYYQNTIVQQNMMRWFRADLEEATSTPSRQKRPWIIVHFHRPIYSTYGTYPVYPKVKNAFEQILYNYGVDLVFAGHIHNQERTLPVYNGTVNSGDDPTRPYHNAKAPVYIVSGNPGNAEEIDPFFKGSEPWSVWRSYGFGYTHLDIINATAIHLDFLSTNLGGKIVDDVTITKNISCGFGVYCNPVIINNTITKKNDVYPRPIVKELYNKWHMVGINKHGVPNAQKNALIQLYKMTNGDVWTRNSNWLIGDPCGNDWYGVACIPITDQTLPDLFNESGITAIQLPSNNLCGEIPDLSALASSLQLLDLGSNLLHGSIHKSLWSMPYLHTLIIEPLLDGRSDLQLSGSFPDDLGNTLPSLHFLFLQRNNLSGPLPSTIGNLPCHVKFASRTSPACHIILDNNHLSGALPKSISNPTWGEFYALHNNFTCPHPPIHAGYTSMDPCP